jgi:hypothetical protein
MLYQLSYLGVAGTQTSSGAAGVIKERRSHCLAAVGVNGIKNGIGITWRRQAEIKLAARVNHFARIS